MVPKSGTSDYNDAFEAGLSHVRVFDALDLATGRGANGETKLIRLEGLRDQPRRKRGTVEVFDDHAFVFLVLRHKEEGTTIYADRQTLTITAVINDDSDSSPGWRDHRIDLKCRFTPAWTDWITINGVHVGQIQLAEFLENHLPDIAAPPAATLFEMVRTLQVKRSVNFNAAVDLDNGQTQILYSEQIDGTTKYAAGTVEIPRTIALSLQPFEGAPRYKVEARLRYRIEAAVLTLWLELVRPEDVLDDAFKDLLARLETTAVPVLAAKAPQPPPEL